MKKSLTDVALGIATRGPAGIALSVGDAGNASADLAYAHAARDKQSKPHITAPAAQHTKEGGVSMPSVSSALAKVSNSAAKATPSAIAKLKTLAPDAVAKATEWYAGATGADPAKVNLAVAASAPANVGRVIVALRKGGVDTLTLQALIPALSDQDAAAAVQGIIALETNQANRSNAVAAGGLLGDNKDAAIRSVLNATEISTSVELAMVRLGVRNPTELSKIVRVLRTINDGDIAAYCTLKGLPQPSVNIAGQ